MNQLFPLALAAGPDGGCVGQNHLLPARHRGLSLGLRRQPLRRPSGPIAWKRLNHRGHQKV
jgi:hypothetical protein